MSITYIRYKLAKTTITPVINFLKGNARICIIVSKTSSIISTETTIENQQLSMNVLIKRQLKTPPKANGIDGTFFIKELFFEGMQSFSKD